MKRIGQAGRGIRFWLTLAAGAMTALWATLPLAQTRPISVDNDQLPVLALTDTAQASLAYSPASPRLVLQLQQAGVRNLSWPSSISRAVRDITENGNAGGLSGSVTFGAAADGPPSESAPLSDHGPDAAREGGFELLGPWPEGSIRTERVALDGRVFYFLMAGPSLERMPHFDTALTEGKAVFDGSARRDFIVAVEGGAAPVAASFVTEGEPRYAVQGARQGDGSPVWTRYDGPASFGVVSTDKGAVVIYRDRGGIFARRLVVADGGLAFGDRWRIAGAPDEIHHYQVVARTDASGAVHLLWSLQPASETQGGKAQLTYCRIDTLDDGNDCGSPQVLSRTAAWQPVNLMTQDRRVYVSWVDTRHTRGIWDRRNFAKLYVAASRDGGRSFGASVPVNRANDNADNARYALTAPAEAGGVLVFWTTKPVQGGWWQGLPFRVGWLDADLGTFRLGREAVPGHAVSDRVEQATLRYHEGLASDGR